jgi:hypothetical protein
MRLLATMILMATALAGCVSFSSGNPNPPPPTTVIVPAR